MPVEFSQAGRGARDGIEAPAVPLDGIRHRANAADRRQRAAFASVLAAVVLASVSVGTGAAQRAYQGIRIWISGSHAAMELHSLATVSYPMAADIRKVARTAVFPVIFPSGIPEGTRIVRIIYSPADRPTTISVEYQPPRGKQFGVTLVQTASIGTVLPAGLKPASVSVIRAGQESVVTPAAFSLPAFLRWNAAPSQSEAQTESLAAPIHIMDQHAPVIAASERIARGYTDAVLIGRVYTAQIAQLAQRKQPLLDSRLVVLTNIPNGRIGPDIGRATHFWPKAVALDASGVRALNAELHRRPCTCPVLVIPSRSGYVIKQFDLQGNVL